jgi:hypothetical protein
MLKFQKLTEFQNIRNTTPNKYYPTKISKENIFSNLKRGLSIPLGMGGGVISKTDSLAERQSSHVE